MYVRLQLELYIYYFQHLQSKYSQSIIISFYISTVLCHYHGTPIELMDYILLSFLITYDNHLNVDPPICFKSVIVIRVKKETCV